MNPMTTDPLLTRLCSDRKYGDVHPDAIRRAIADARRRYTKPKDIEHAARERLHGVTSAFNDLRGADPSDDLEKLLARHASTRERLPLERMDEIYRRIFEVTGEPENILDLACGLNPLYLTRRVGCAVTGVDISRGCIELLSNEQNFTGIWADLLSEGALPEGRFHIALLFKLLPLLEREEAGSAVRLMESINARYLVISFPTRTMAGRDISMARHYSDWLEGHMPGGRVIVSDFVDGNEMFFVMGEGEVVSC